MSGKWTESGGNRTDILQVAQWVTTLNASRRFLHVESLYRRLADATHREQPPATEGMSGRVPTDERALFSRRYAPKAQAAPEPKFPGGLARTHRKAVSWFL